MGYLLITAVQAIPDWQLSNRYCHIHLSKTIHQNFKPIILRLIPFLLIFAASGSCYAEKMPSVAPDEMVRQVIDGILLKLRQNSELAHNLAKLDDIVESQVLPHLDIDRLTRLTIGKQDWGGANAQEKRQLVNEYRTFLKHTFSDVISQYNGQTIFYFPVKIDPDDKSIIIKTTVIDPHEEPTELDYWLESTQNGWMIVDIYIDGISMIKIYHSNFQNELGNGGVENLIHTLHAKNMSVESARRTN